MGAKCSLHTLNRMNSSLSSYVVPFPGPTQLHFLSVQQVWKDSEKMGRTLGTMCQGVLIRYDSASLCSVVPTPPTLLLGVLIRYDPAS